MSTETSRLGAIREKVEAGQRLSFEDGLALEESNDLFALGRAGQPGPRAEERQLRLLQRQHAPQPDERLRLHAATSAPSAPTSTRPEGYVMTDEQILERGRAGARARRDRAAHRRRAAPPAAVRVVRRRRPLDPRGLPRAAPQGVHRRRDRVLRQDRPAVDRARSSSELIDAGLGSLPGGGAEIFHPEVREQICEHKADDRDWLDVHRDGPPARPALQRHDALRPHREARAPHRPPDPAARAAGRDRRLPDVHPAGLPPRQLAAGRTSPSRRA